MGVDYASAKGLLDAVRAFQVTEDWSKVDWTRPSGPRLLAAEVGGWLDPLPGEPAEPTGFRPLGALVNDLLATVTAAGLPSDEETVLRAYFGLDRHPMAIGNHNGENFNGVVGTLGPERRPAWKLAKVQRIKQQAIHDLAAVLDTREHPAPRPIYAVSCPLSTSWFGTRSSPMRVRILNEARVQAVLRTTTAGPNHEVGVELRSKIAEWFDRAAKSTSARQSDTLLPRREFNPIRAAASIAMWSVASDLDQPRTISPSVFTELGRYAPLRGMDAELMAAVAMLLTARDSDLDYRALASVIVKHSDADGSIAADILLKRSRTSPQPGAHALALDAAIRVGTQSEDMRVLRWTASLQRVQPSTEMTLRARSRSGIVAGGNWFFPLAQSQLWDALSEVESVQWANDKDPTIESTEWRRELRLNLYGQMRREEGAKLHKRSKPLTHPIREELARLIIELDQSEPLEGGSPRDLWLKHRVRAEHRLAELALIDAQYALLAGEAPTQVRQHISTAKIHLSRGTEFDQTASSSGSSSDSHVVQVTKSFIWIAALESDEIQLARWLRHLRALGWSVWRSAPPVVAAVVEIETGRRSSGLPDGVRGVVRRALDQLDRSPMPDLDLVQRTVLPRHVVP